MLQIIGAGLGRTGTHSLGRAIEMLGFGPCYTIFDVEKNSGHSEAWRAAMDEETVDWRALFAGYQAAVEWPTVAFLPQIFNQFPSCKVILTTRDPESWYDSASATIFPALEISACDPDPKRREQGAWKRDLILNRVFNGRYRDREYTVGLYAEHVSSVIELVPPSQLLEFQVGEGWQPLCTFLHKPVPDVPFPRVNERTDFLASAPEWARKFTKPSDESSDEMLC
jgi:hypothetical protein